MEIINTSKVALVLVSTEEASEILCRKQYLARPTGDIIDASKYYYDYEKFCIRMPELMKYNWFLLNALIAPDQELFQALYEETHGTIDRIISEWMDIQTAYVISKIKPAIKGDFIRLISSRANPLLTYYT